MLQESLNYAITNKKSGNALDLSGADYISVIGYPYQGRDNQKWTSIPQDNRWAILNKTGSCLSFEGVPRNGVKMMGIPNLRFFEIIPAEDQEPGYYRIFFPQCNLYVTLSGVDSNAPVELRNETGGDDQVWKFQQV